MSEPGEDKFQNAMEWARREPGKMSAIVGGIGALITLMTVRESWGKVLAGLTAVAGIGIPFLKGKGEQEENPFAPQESAFAAAATQPLTPNLVSAAARRVSPLITEGGEAAEPHPAYARVPSPAAAQESEIS